MARITASKPIENSGLSAELSGEIFDQIARFAGYGFNKSHAAAYAAISFQTAALKAHYPEQFFAAAMNLDLGEVKEIAAFAAELKSRGLPLWQPSINASRAVFTPVKLNRPLNGFSHGIAYALTGIRGVGRDVALAIEADRTSRGPYASVDDFLARAGQTAPKKALEALAKAGAFDLFGLGRAEALAAVAARDTAAAAGQMSMFDMMDAAPATDVVALTRDEILDNEFDVLGHYMSAHPLDDMVARRFEEGYFLSDFVLNGSDKALRKVRMPAVICDIDVRRTRNGDTMAVLLLSDPEGVYEALAFSDTWTEIRGSLKKKARLMFEVSVSDRGSERRIMIDGVSAITAPGGTGTLSRAA